MENKIHCLPDKSWMLTPEKNLSMKTIDRDVTTERQCRKCDAEFSAVMRHHRCQSCEKFYCGFCSDLRLVNSNVNETKRLRLCVDCLPLHEGRSPVPFSKSLQITESSSTDKENESASRIASKLSISAAAFQNNTSPCTPPPTALSTSPKKTTFVDNWKPLSLDGTAVVSANTNVCVATSPVSPASRVPLAQLSDCCINSKTSPSPIPLHRNILASQPASLGTEDLGSRMKSDCVGNTWINQHEKMESSTTSKHQSQSQAGEAGEACEAIEYVGQHGNESARGPAGVRECVRDSTDPAASDALQLENSEAAHDCSPTIATTAAVIDSSIAATPRVIDATISSLSSICFSEEKEEEDNAHNTQDEAQPLRNEETNLLQSQQSPCMAEGRPRTSSSSSSSGVEAEQAPLRPLHSASSRWVEPSPSPLQTSSPRSLSSGPSPGESLHSLHSSVLYTSPTASSIFSTSSLDSAKASAVHTSLFGSDVGEEEEGEEHTEGLHCPMGSVRGGPRRRNRRALLPSGSREDVAPGSREEVAPGSREDIAVGAYQLRKHHRLQEIEHKAASSAAGAAGETETGAAAAAAGGSRAVGGLRARYAARLSRLHSYSLQQQPTTPEAAAVFTSLAASADLVAATVGGVVEMSPEASAMDADDAGARVKTTVETEAPLTPQASTAQVAEPDELRHTDADPDAVDAGYRSEDDFVDGGVVMSGELSCCGSVFSDTPRSSPGSVGQGGHGLSPLMRGPGVVSVSPGHQPEDVESEDDDEVIREGRLEGLEMDMGDISCRGSIFSDVLSAPNSPMAPVNTAAAAKASKARPDSDAEQIGGDAKGAETSDIIVSYGMVPSRASDAPQGHCQGFLQLESTEITVGAPRAAVIVAESMMPLGEEMATAVTETGAGAGALMPATQKTPSEENAAEVLPHKMAAVIRSHVAESEGEAAATKPRLLCPEAERAGLAEPIETVTGPGGAAIAGTEALTHGAGPHNAGYKIYCEAVSSVGYETGSVTGSAIEIKSHSVPSPVPPSVSVPAAAAAEEAKEAEEAEGPLEPVLDPHDLSSLHRLRKQSQLCLATETAAPALAAGEFSSGNVNADAVVVAVASIASVAVDDETTGGAAADSSSCQSRVGDEASDINSDWPCLDFAPAVSPQLSPMQSPKAGQETVAARRRKTWTSLAKVRHLPQALQEMHQRPGTGPGETAEGGRRETASKVDASGILKRGHQHDHDRQEQQMEDLYMVDDNDSCVSSGIERAQQFNHPYYRALAAVRATVTAAADADTTAPTGGTNEGQQSMMEGPQGPLETNRNSSSSSSSAAATAASDMLAGKPPPGGSRIDATDDVKRYSFSVERTKIAGPGGHEAHKTGAPPGVTMSSVPPSAAAAAAAATAGGGGGGGAERTPQTQLNWCSLFCANTGGAFTAGSAASFL